MIGGEAPIVYSQLINNSDTVYTQNRLVKYRHQPRQTRPPAHNRQQQQPDFLPMKIGRGTPAEEAFTPPAHPLQKKQPNFPTPGACLITPCPLGDGCPDCIGTRVRGKLMSKEVIVRQIRLDPRQRSPSMLRRTQHVPDFLPREKERIMHDNAL